MIELSIIQTHRKLNFLTVDNSTQAPFPCSYSIRLVSEWIWVRFLLGSVVEIIISDTPMECDISNVRSNVSNSQFLVKYSERNITDILQMQAPEVVPAQIPSHNLSYEFFLA